MSMAVVGAPTLDVATYFASVGWTLELDPPSRLQEDGARADICRLGPSGNEYFPAAPPLDRLSRTIVTEILDGGSMWL